MEWLAEKITVYITHNKRELKNEQIETIKFGLECILSEASKILAYFVIFYLFNVTDLYLISLIFFCVLRAFAGGVHANTYIQCFFISLGILSAGIFTGSQIGLEFPLRIGLLTLSIVLIIIFAPVDHPNKPIISPIRRKKLKYLAIFVFIILSGSTFFIEDRLATTAVVILVLEAISLPIGYILKRSRYYENTES